MSNFVKTIISLSVLAFLAGCSDSPSDSGPTDDTLPQTVLAGAVLTFSNAADSASKTAITFRLVPITAGKNLWVSEAEITDAQYAAIMDTTPAASGYPKSMTWFQAASFANALGAKCSAHVQVLKDSIALDTSRRDSLGSFAFSSLYYNAGACTVSAPRVILSPLICVISTDASAIDTTFLKFWGAESLTVRTVRIDSVRIAVTDTHAVDSLLKGRPDSLAYSGSWRRVLPTEQGASTLRDSVISALLSLGQDSISLLAFRHSYWKNDSTRIYNNAAGTLVSQERVLRLIIALKDYPSTEVLRDSVLQSYAGLVLPHPDTLILRPDSLIYTVDVWKTGAGYGFRLPTEDEWEAAASCGMGLEFSTYNGGLTDESAVFNTSSTAPAPGERKPNPYGLYDFTGNLYEWVNDWWSPASDPDYPHYFPTKVIKGGCYNSAPDDQALRVYGRFSEVPDATFGNRTGCRIVIENSVFWSYYRR